MNAPDSAPTKLLPGALSAVDLPSNVAQLIPEGKPFDAPSFLERHPELLKDKSLVLTLAYKEFWQLKDEGNEVDCEAFCNRFPHHKSSVRQLLALHQFFENSPELLTEAQQASWPQPGTDFLGFRIERELGRGGLARVYLAKETALGNRPVAIKVSRLELGEAQTLGKLRHPNIVPVHSIQACPAGGMNVICMPYLGSATLCDVLDRAYATGMPTSADVIQEAAQEHAPPGELAKIRGAYIDAVLGIVAQLADALAFAHSIGICHRDLKPSNVLVAFDGRPMLLDFNLAFDAELEDNRFGGTIPYMPPEQLRRMDSGAGTSGQADARSDVFSLGIILFELLTGTHPFGPFPATKGNLVDTRNKLLECQKAGPRSPRQLNPSVDRNLARVVESCLAYDPAQRPPSAKELASALRRATSLRRRLARWTKRNRTLVAGILALLVLAGTVSGYHLGTRPPYHVRQWQAGLTTYQQRDYRQAIKHYNQALEEQPNDIKILFSRGRAHQQMGNYQLALADYIPATHCEENGLARACEGYCLCKLALFNQGELVLRMAMEKGIDNAQMRNNYGYCLRHLGRLDEAEKFLSEAIAMDSTLQVPYYNRAMLRYTRHLNKSRPGLTNAVQDMEKALSLGPPTSDLCRHAAAIFAVAGLEEKALSWLARAIDLGLDPSKLEYDISFKPLYSNARYQELMRKATSVTPTESVRLLDPIKD